MARVYASEAELAAHRPGGDTVPADHAGQLLAIASRLVDQLMVARAYPHDDQGMPTDAEHVTAFRDATCATAIELHNRGALEAGDGWEAVSIGSVSLSGRTSDGSMDVFGLPVPHAAALYLADVGTASVRVRS